MLYIIRHGKTDWNVRHKLQGRTDIPLNEEGRQMAEAAREEYRDVHFDVYFCSPLIRARETAEILFEENPKRLLANQMPLEIPVVSDDYDDELPKNPFLRAMYRFFTGHRHDDDEEED